MIFNNHYKFPAPEIEPANFEFIPNISLVNKTTIKFQLVKMTLVDKLNQVDLIKIEFPQNYKIL